MLILSFSIASNSVESGHNDSLNLKFQENNDFNKGIFMFNIHPCSEKQNQKS